MPDTWTVAGVQMDCALGDKAANLAAMTRRLGEAAERVKRRVIELFVSAAVATLRSATAATCALMQGLRGDT